ncbi:hypothetical protein PCL_10438 [Purpureocillium lilacinum]|uniref:Uncharacterized protein n=1 Tax=Purpureocillium lilacinum TaxID=33203 RepID=A0A2U3DQD7_PURLI|nr:hypothetical protein PCL_10438 [Purpureocillium lilacinum]
MPTAKDLDWMNAEHADLSAPTESEHKIQFPRVGRPSESQQTACDAGRICGWAHSRSGALAGGDSRLSTVAKACVSIHINPDLSQPHLRKEDFIPAHTSVVTVLQDLSHGWTCAVCQPLKFQMDSPQAHGNQFNDPQRPRPGRRSSSTPKSAQDQQQRRDMQDWPTIRCTPFFMGAHTCMFDAQKIANWATRAAASNSRDR